MWNRDGCKATIADASIGMAHNDVDDHIAKSSLGMLNLLEVVLIAE